MSSRMLLRTFAVLFAVLAVSNVTKVFEFEPEHGLVFLGLRQSGTPNMVLAPIFGAYLAIYAWGLWNLRRFALPMGIGYAGWVPLNMYLFTVRSPEELATNSLFGVTYMVLAMAVSLGAAVALMRSARDLR